MLRVPVRWMSFQHCKPLALLISSQAHPLVGSLSWDSKFGSLVSKGSDTVADG